MRTSYEVGAEIIKKGEKTCVGIYTEQFMAESHSIQIALLVESFGILHLDKIIVNTVLKHISEYKQQISVFKDGCTEAVRNHILRDWRKINNLVNRAAKSLSITAAGNAAMIIADDIGNAWLFKTGKIHIAHQTKEPTEAPDESAILNSGIGFNETLTVACIPIKVENNITLMTNGIAQSKSCIEVFVTSQDSAPRDIIQKISHLINQTKVNRKNSEGIVCIHPSKSQE